MSNAIRKTTKKETVTLPKKAVSRMFAAMGAFEEAQDELEDYLTLSNDAVMNDVKKARREHRQGERKELHSLKKRYEV